MYLKFCFYFTKARIHTKTTCKSSLLTNLVLRLLIIWTSRAHEKNLWLCYPYLQVKHLMRLFGQSRLQYLNCMSVAVNKLNDFRGTGHAVWKVYKVCLMENIYISKIQQIQAILVQKLEWEGFYRNNNFSQGTGRQKC